MAKKKEMLNYKRLTDTLGREGPQRLYLLYGPEEYLREQFVTLLKNTCLPGGENDFSYKRLTQESFSVSALEDAVEAFPFLTERSFVEVRGVDLNRLGANDGEKLSKILENIPDYCTLVFVQDAGFEPDGRKKLYKTVKKFGREVSFTEQPQNSIVNWVRRRFKAHEKAISPDTAAYLVEYAGHFMQQLIPEIEKVAAYAPDEIITEEDIRAVASKSAETVVFDLTDRLAERDYETAAEILGELLGRKDTEPIMLLGMIGKQMRDLYAAKLAEAEGRDGEYLTAVTGKWNDYALQKLRGSAKKFSMPRLERAVELCAETDYQMKSSGAEDTELLTDLLLKLAFDGA